MAALVPIRVDRTSKPPIGTPLRSDGHWSVQGLVGAWAMNEFCGLIDLVTYSRSAINNALWSAKGLQFNSSSPDSVDITFNPSTVGTLVFTEYIPTNWGAEESSFLFDGYTSSNRWLFYRQPNGSFGLYMNGTPIAYSFNLNPTPENSNKNFIAICWDSISGKERVHTCLASADFSEHFTALSPGKIRIGCRYTLEEGFSGILSSPIIIYNRWVSNNELLSIKLNPWQIFEPETFWVNVDSGSAIVPNIGASLLMGM